MKKNRKKVLGTLGILVLLVLTTWVTDHGYLWSGIQETYLRGWKNSNIDDIEFRDLRTIHADSVGEAWISKEVWG
ncbi:MAG: hypothetical protein ACO2XQ_09675, partial [Flavobacteriales bacterium]